MNASNSSSLANPTAKVAIEIHVAIMSRKRFLINPISDEKITENAKNDLWK
jgi:hypothetical protein